MVHPSVWLLVLFSLHSSALPSQNGSLLRTFSGRAVIVDEPVDYLDLSVLDSLSDDRGYGSGSQQEPEKRHGRHGPHHRPQTHYVVSEEAKAFLQGLLATSFVPTVYTLVFIISVPLNLVAMVIIDRFLAVVYPMNSLTWRSPQTASAVCASMWLLALGGVSPLLISGQTIHLTDLGITTCHDVQDTETLQAYYLYFFPIYSSVFFFIPLVFTAVCYVRIIQALAATNVENRSKKTRAVVMAVMVLVVFVVCFTPTNIILMVHYVRLSHKSSDSLYQAYLLSMCVGSVSCCLDPVLYYFGSSQCQKQVAALLRCRRLVREDTKTTRTSGRSDSSSCKMESVQIGVGSQYSRLVA
ncbi:hypothetical protein PAMP_022433 [Pampus punctatissimus]